MPRCGVLIVSTNQLLREGLKSGLCNAEIDIVGEAEDFSGAAAHLDKREVPPVIILINTRSYSLLQILCEVGEARRLRADSKIVVLSDTSVPEDVLRALQGGVNALLSIDASVATILGCLELVMSGHQIVPMLPGGCLVSPDLTGAAGNKSRVRTRTPALLVPAVAGTDNLVSFSQRAAGSTAEVVTLKPPRAAVPYEEPTLASPVLSDREEQVLHCLISGHPNKIIARALGIAETTVKVHVKSVLRKVGASNRTQAAIWALHQRAPQVERDVSGLPASQLQAG